jgi:putative flippase GtrA
MEFRHFYHSLRQSRLVQSFLVGCIALIVQTSLFEVLAVLLRVCSPSTAVLLGAEGGVLTNYYINNAYTFSDRQHQISRLSRIVRFHLVVSGSVFIQWLLVYLVEKSTSSLLLIHVAYFTGLGIGFVWNYTLYKLVVWQHIN